MFEFANSIGIIFLNAIREGNRVGAGDIYKIARRSIVTSGFLRSKSKLIISTSMCSEVRREYESTSVAGCVDIMLFYNRPPGTCLINPSSNSFCVFLIFKWVI